MTERFEADAGNCRTIDEALGDVRFWQKSWTLRLQAHVSDEPYRGRTRGDLVSLAASGTRTCVHARP